MSGRACPYLIAVHQIDLQPNPSHRNGIPDLNPTHLRGIDRPVFSDYDGIYSQYTRNACAGSATWYHDLEVAYGAQ